MKYDYDCPKCEKHAVKTRPMAEDEPDYFCDDCGTKLKRDYGDATSFISSPGMYSYDKRSK